MTALVTIDKLSKHFATKLPWPKQPVAPHVRV